MSQSTPHTFPLTIGIDLGARNSAYCVQTPDREIATEGTLEINRDELGTLLEQHPGARIVIEASGPSRWVRDFAQELGHEVLVANPREFRVIAESHKKTDRNDARVLARFGQVFPELLHPVQLRGVETQLVRNMLTSRDLCVAQRTKHINLVRALVRNLGHSLPSGSAAAFHRTMKPLIPEELRPLTDPHFHLLEVLSDSISGYDRKLENYAKKVFSEAGILRQVTGVGLITALAFVVTIEDPARFARSRDVGAYAGLVPKARSSGGKTPELSVSKRGDKIMRRLLVGAAAYIVRSSSPDCDLKRYGERLQGRGGQAARGKARIAVARKLAVLLHQLWITGEVYDPDRNLLAAA